MLSKKKSRALKAKKKIEITNYLKKYPGLDPESTIIPNQVFEAYMKLTKELLPDAVTPLNNAQQTWLSKNSDFNFIEIFKIAKRRAKKETKSNHFTLLIQIEISRSKKHETIVAEKIKAAKAVKKNQLSSNPGGKPEKKEKHTIPKNKESALITSPEERTFNFKPVLQFEYKHYVKMDNVPFAKEVISENKDPNEDLRGSMIKAQKEKTEFKGEKEKILVDTNVIYNVGLLKYLLDPEIVLIISGVVVEELDKHKGNSLRPDRQFNARIAIRQLLLAHQYNLFEFYDDGIKSLESKVRDNDLIIIEDAKNTGSTLHTLDGACYLRAAIRKVKCFHPELDAVFSNAEKRKYLGHKMFTTTVSHFDWLESRNYVNTFQELGLRKDPVFNQFIVLKREDASGKELIFRKNPNGKLQKFNNFEQHLKNANLYLKPMDNFQSMALDMLFDDDISIVVINGLYGSGKTLLAIAAALANMEGICPKMNYFLARPPITHNKKMELGFKPGSFYEKMLPWLKGLFHNIEFLMAQSVPSLPLLEMQDLILKDIETYSEEDPEYINWVKDVKKKLKDQKKGYNDRKNKIKKMSGEKETLFELIDAESIQGSSFNDSFIILDESQYFSNSDMEQFISRGAKGTKLIILGDWGQSYGSVRESESGYTHLLSLIETVNRKEIGFINLEKIYRGPAADIAHKVFKELA